MKIKTGAIQIKTNGYTDIVDITTKVQGLIEEDLFEEDFFQEDFL